MAQFNDDVFVALGDLGYTGTYNDRFFVYLGDQGYTGTLQDRMMSWFGDQGYTGGFADRWFQWAVGGFTFGPQFAVVEDDLGLVIEATFTQTATDLVVDVTAPPAYVGTYLADLDALALGPVNIIPPDVTGTVGTGNVATATAGIWVYDLDQGTPTITRQWEREDGTDIVGETGTTYTQQASDPPLGVSIRETATNTQGSTDVVTVFVAAVPLSAVRFDSATRLGPVGSGSQTNRKYTYVVRLEGVSIVSAPSELFGRPFRAGVLGNSSTQIGIHCYRDFSASSGLTFASYNYTHGGGPVSVMVAADFDGGLDGGRTIDIWINGARRASHSDTNAGWSWDLPIGSLGVIGYGNAGFNKVSVIHYGHVWVSQGNFLDPTTYWSDFFNVDNTMKDIGATGVIGGVTPNYYYPLTSMLTGDNLGSSADLTLTGTPVEIY